MIRENIRFAFEMGLIITMLVFLLSFNRLVNLSMYANVIGFVVECAISFVCLFAVSLLVGNEPLKKEE